ncbi:ScbA/BarX family gamma-butyrolactone biosynthesis protein [Streptomyces sp. NPDC035033]|uniref:ScbA/BarX family gamma-butyrolactone biosynthesis protein n=1 Tax=Streptomyces sp. NPDC035033 TaxID=3155368 RepID=UPI0033D925EC
MDRHDRQGKTTVPGEFVHRSDPADIIPTGWTRFRENRFSVSATWPRSHPYFSPVDGDRHDPILIAETIRQATMLVAHAELGVPVDSQFVLRDLSYDAEPEALAVDATAADTDVTVDVILSDVRGHGRGLRGLRTTTVLTRGGRLLATGSGLTSCTSAAAYRRIRGPQLALLGRPVPLIPGLPPETVGRERAEDVVLGRGTRPGQWQLRIDTGHPTLFRRPNDHVPGMLLLEAARQAAHALMGAEAFFPSAMNVSFFRYAELEPPCWITAEAVPAADPRTLTVRIDGHQDGRPVFVCTLSSPAGTPAVARLDHRLAG